MNSRPTSELRILLLGNNPADAEMVTSELARYNPGWVVQRVESAPSFHDALEAFTPDVIISDQGLGSLSCSEALRIAQERRPGTPFLLLSSTFEQATSDCLKSGADDFIRRADLSRLGSAVTTAWDARAPLRKLSSRQLEVLQLLAAGRSTRAIAEQLTVSVKTVETHRAQVMRRLGIRDLAGLVRYAVRVGLISAYQ